MCVCIISEPLFVYNQAHHACIITTHAFRARTHVVLQPHARARARTARGQGFSCLFHFPCPRRYAVLCPPLAPLVPQPDLTFADTTDDKRERERVWETQAAAYFNHFISANMYLRWRRRMLCAADLLQEHPDSTPTAHRHTLAHSHMHAYAWVTTGNALGNIRLNQCDASNT